MSVSGRILLAITISTGCAAPARETAIDPFVGEWKLDPARSKAIDRMQVENVGGDTYAFHFEGGPRETIAVDGSDQPAMPGTTLAVTADAPHEWKVVRKKDGRTMIVARWKLSADNHTLADDFTQYGEDGQVVFHQNYVYQRTADGQGFAGTWESPLPLDEIPSATLEIRPYEATGLTFIHPSHIVRSMKFDGKDYPLVGRAIAAGTTSSGRRVGQRSLELTEKRDGKIDKTEQLEVSPDLHTLIQTTHPAGQRAPNVFVFARQATGRG